MALRSHDRTLTIEGEPRALRFARLDLGQRANVAMLLSMFRMQEERLTRLATQPIAQQLAEMREERAANLQFGAWVEETIRAHVAPAEPWTTADGMAVTDGASFVEAYGNDELITALMVLFSVNTVTQATAKNSESPRDSSPGSADGSLAARGDAPAPTVEPAAPSGSASPAAAPALPDPSPSGSTTTAPAPSPTSVLSAV